MNIFTIFIIFWTIMIAIEHSWNGFKKFLGLIFFPGEIVRTFIKLNLIDISADSIYVFIDKRDIFYYLKGEIKNPRQVLKIIFYPAIVNASLTIISLFLLTYMSDYLLKFFMMWLAYSFFRAMLPSSDELYLLFIHTITRNKFTIIALFMTIILFPIIYTSLGLDYSILIVFIYILGILILNSMRSNGNYIIMNE